jgi:Asp/Glu/hydantoin racemase
VGVLGLSGEALPSVSEVLGNHLCAAAAPKGVETANDLYGPGGEELFVEPAQRLIDRGAKAIALACTGFSTVGAAAGLTARLGVPVVDPVIAAGCVIRFMMTTRPQGQAR